MLRLGLGDVMEFLGLEVRVVQVAIQLPIHRSPTKGGINQFSNAELVVLLLQRDNKGEKCKRTFSENFTKFLPDDSPLVLDMRKVLTMKKTNKISNTVLRGSSW